MVVHEPSSASELSAAFRLHNDLHRSVERNELQAYFQPQVMATDNRLLGFEALMRWNHPELGLISPVRFIPIAEDNDQIVSEAAKFRYRSGGEFSVPITVRSPYGGGIFGGQTHSQSPESLFTHIAGIKTVIPSNPYDAKGLLISAIEDDDPVVFFEPKRLYNGPFNGWHDRPVSPWTGHELAEVPEGHYSIPLGKARVMREGADVTVLCYGTMVWVSLAAAEDTTKA